MSKELTRDEAFGYVKATLAKIFLRGEISESTFRKSIAHVEKLENTKPRNTEGEQ